MKTEFSKGGVTKTVRSFGTLYCPKSLVFKHLSYLTGVMFLFFLVIAFVNAVPKSAKAEAGTEFVPGVIMVKFAEGVKVETEKKEGYVTTGIPSIDALNKKYGVKNFVKIFSPEPKSENDKTAYREMGLGRIYKFDTVPKADVQAMVAEYKVDPSVEYAEPDYVGHAHFIPNDPNFVSRQWGLYNTGLNPPEHPGTVDADVDATEAWPWWTPEHVIVLAILDTGVDIDHPDFWWSYPNGVIWENTPECAGTPGIDDDHNGYVDDCHGYDFVNNDGNPQDDNGHGTVNAGIAGAITNNNVGVASLAGGPFNPQLIMPVKVINSANSFQYSNLIAGIYYAANNGARVINMSMGGFSYSSTLETAVNYAWGTKGCVLVASMGNCNSSTPQYPAAFTNTIAVGATDTDDSRCVPPDWDFMGTDAMCGSVHGSNYGSHIDVVAPGNWIYSTVWNDTYGYWAGTSMAAPFVSGLAAMIMCQYWPEPSPDSVRQIIQRTADDTVGLPSEDTPGWDQYYGWGRINAKRALGVPKPMYAEDFNDSNITNWTVYTGKSGTFATTTSQWVSPSCGLHMVSQSGGYAYGRTPDFCIDTTQDFTITTYFRLPDNNNHWFWVLSNGWVEIVIDYGPELSAYQGAQGPTLLLDSLNTNQWYHIKAVVHPATSNYDIYLNCYKITTAKFPGTYLRYLRLGDFENGGSNFGEGYWDDVAVYGKKFLRGDANADGKITSADVVYLINYLFISGPVPVPWRAGDVNSDGAINASDVVYLINYLFIGGPPPPC